MMSKFCGVPRSLAYGLLTALSFFTANTSAQTSTPAPVNLVELSDARGCKLYSSFSNTVKTIVLGRVSGASCVNGLYQGPAIYGLTWVVVRPSGTSDSYRGLRAAVLVDGRPDGLNMALYPSNGVFLLGVPQSKTTNFFDAGVNVFLLRDVQAGIDENAPNAGGRYAAAVAAHLKSVAEQWASQRDQLMQLVSSPNPESLNPNWGIGSNFGTTTAPTAGLQDDPKVMGSGERPR